SSTTSRTGSITAAGQSFVITQAAAIAQSYNASVAISGPAQIVRAEGFAELLADELIALSGQAAVGGVKGDLLVTYNTNISNHLPSSDSTSQTTDALLLLTDPAPQNLAVGTNAFRGVLAGANAIRFPNVPLAPAAGGSFTNMLRITGVRVNANATPGPAPVQV